MEEEHLPSLTGLPVNARGEEGSNSDDLLSQHVNAFFQFKDKTLWEDFQTFNRSRTSSITVFLFAVLLTLVMIPYGVWILWSICASSDGLTTFHFTMLGLTVMDLVLFWLVYFIQLAKLKKIPETKLFKLIQPYSPHIQTGLYFVAMAYSCLRLLSRVFQGQCSGTKFYETWDCNPVADAESLPTETLLLVLTMPFVLALMLKEVGFLATLVSLAGAVATVVIAATQVHSTGVLLPTIIFYIFLCLILFYDLRKQSYTMFFINQKLRETLAENERIADEMHANEMRSMIANVAHDLKTPLSSFLSGVEYIGQVVLDLKHLMEKKESLNPEDLEEFIVSIIDCIGNIKSTNSFMLMTINRCIDYTKASKGLKLVPKFETIDLYDTLLLPLNCMSDIQSRVVIHLNDIPAEICSHIITDKQWLQENVLCLLSNAVKYSTDGEVTITISLRKLTSADEDMLDKMKHIFAGRKKPISNRVLPDEELGDGHNLQQVEELSGRESNESISVQDNFEHGAEIRYKYSRQKKQAIPDRYLVVEIEDHGIGISDEVMAGLFSPFKQAQRLAGGTGLGLYSLMKRVEALHGYCGVRRRKNGDKGSLFWFEIPYRADRIYAALNKNKKGSLHRNGRSFAASSSTSFTISSTNSDSAISNGSANGNKQVNNVDSSSSNELGLGPIPSLATKPLPSILSRSKSAEEQDFSANNISYMLDIDSLECTPLAMAKQSSLSELPGTPTGMESSAGHVQTSAELRRALRLKIAPPPLNILLVEDTLSILKMTSMMLKRHGHTISCAENGEEALKRIKEQLQKHSVPFDVILMDLQMPVMDGLEAAKRLRFMESAGQITARSESSIRSLVASPTNRSRNKPLEPLLSVNMQGIKHVIIGVSANSDHETMESAYQVGFDAFIAKPFSIDTFYETIEDVRRSTHPSK